MERRGLPDESRNDAKNATPAQFAPRTAPSTPVRGWECGWGTCPHGNRHRAFACTIAGYVLDSGRSGRLIRVYRRPDPWRGAGRAVAQPTRMTNVTDQREMAELIDLFFKCIKAPPATERHVAYGTAFNAKLEEHVSASPTEDMRAFARQVSALGTIPYTRAFSQVVQIRSLAR